MRFRVTFTASGIIVSTSIARIAPAATAQEARGGAYYGPTGMMEARGPLGLAKVPPAATDADYLDLVLAGAVYNIFDDRVQTGYVSAAG